MPAMGGDPDTRSDNRCNAKRSICQVRNGRRCQLNLHEELSAQHSRKQGMPISAPNHPVTMECSKAHRDAPVAYAIDVDSLCCSHFLTDCFLRKRTPQLRISCGAFFHDHINDDSKTLRLATHPVTPPVGKTRVTEKPLSSKMKGILSVNMPVRKVPVNHHNNKQSASVRRPKIAAAPGSPQWSRAT